MSDSLASTPSIVPDEPAVKPKRQLTEAQRLAFLKAREARAKNIALRREQKLAQEELTKTAEAELGTEGAPTGDGNVNVTVRKAPAKRTRKPKEPKELKSAPEPMVVTPEQPPKELICPPAPAPSEVGADDLGEHFEQMANRVTEMIYQKLNAEELPEEPPVPPKPKVKRAKVIKAKAVAVEKTPIPPIPSPDPFFTKNLAVELETQDGGSGLATQHFGWA